MTHKKCNDLVQAFLWSNTVDWMCSVKKAFREILRKTSSARVSLVIKLQASDLFSSEFCEKFANILFYRTPPGDCFSIVNFELTIKDYSCPRIETN